MNYKTFASHASRDRLSGRHMQSFFDRLASRIVALGGTKPGQPTMFVDHKNIQSGAPWEQVLGDAVSESEAYLFMVSPAFTASVWCGKETGVAFSRYSSPGTPAQGSFLFPVKWEVSPLQTQGGCSGIPTPLDKFQHRPTGLSDATAKDYEKLGISPMMAQNKHRDKVTELIDQWAREIVTGTSKGLLPPHTPITDMDKVQAPPGWAGAGARLPLDVQHHLCIAPGATFAAGGGELQMRRVMQSAFEVMQARALQVDARAAGLSGRIKAAAKSGQILLVIADAALGEPDRVMKAINACKQKPRLAFLLLDTESGNTTSPVPEQWLTVKNLATGCFSQAFVSGHVKVTTPSSLAADMDWLLQKVRGEAIESGRVAAAQDAKAAAEAEKSGISVGNRPVVSGPAKKQ